MLVIAGSKIVVEKEKSGEEENWQDGGGLEDNLELAHFKFGACFKMRD